MGRPFRSYILDQVLCAYDNYERRYMDKLAPKIELTVDDVFRLVVPEEHRHLSKQAVEICGVEGSTAYNIEVPDPSSRRRIGVRINYVDWTGRWRRTKPFPFAWNQNNTPLAQDAEVGARINTWAAGIGGAKREWARGGSAITALYDCCDTAQQMRYYFPAILTLLRQSDTIPLNELADKLQEYTVPKKFVDLPPPLKEALAKAQQNITKSLLLPDPKGEVKSPVEVTLANFEQGPWPWVNWVRPE
jgi:hypothetical protein